MSLFDVRTEMEIGGTWTDVTVRHHTPISMRRGRPNEGSRVDPGRCSLVLDNRTGKYSPRDPAGPYYGLIGRGARLRVSVMTGATYLDLPTATGPRATTPDHASLDITGDIDVRFEMTTETIWQQTGYAELIGKYDNISGNQRTWRLGVTAGRLAFGWSTDGTLPTFLQRLSAYVPVPPSGHLAVRATLDVNNGAGGHTVVFYTAPTLAGPWTQLGDAQATTGTTSIYAGTASLDIGDSTGMTFPGLSGKVHGAEVRSGIGGTLVANPRFDQQASGVTSFVDSAGRTWTLAGGAAITNRRTRFSGEVSSWLPRHDTSGQDAYVLLEASGSLRRLGAGGEALASTLRRRLPSLGPLAYWPMEDGRDATQAASPIAGIAPLTATGAAFASDDTLAGSSALPRVAGARLLGTVPAGGTGTWDVGLVFRLDTLPASGDHEVIRFVTTGTAAVWRIGADAGGVNITLRTTGGALVASTSLVVDYFAGDWNVLHLRASQNGGSVDLEVFWRVIGGTEGNDWTSSYAGTVGDVTTIDTQVGAGLTTLRMGHLGVFGANATSYYDSADNGFLGEYAMERVPRLCAEQGVAVNVAGGGDITTTVRLGSQRPGTLLALLGEAADADLGILGEQRESLALRYRPGALTYNQAPTLALDYEARGHVSPPLELADDDQALRNDITVQRVGGSSARAVAQDGPLSVQDPPAGVGRYAPSPVALSLQADEQTVDQAWWRLHLGTADEARYPTVRVNLTAAPALIDAASTVDLRDRITISNPPQDGPPGTVDLLVEGYQERLSPTAWDITFNCSPGAPWRAAVLDDAVLGRCDTAGSQLTVGVNATAASLSVATTTGPLWTTDSAEFPLDVLVAGEQMTVTNITGSSSPQTFTVARAANGVVKAQLAGADVRLAQPMILALQ